MTSSSSTSHVIDWMLENELIPFLLPLLSSSDEEEITLPILTILVNMTSGTAEQLDKVLRYNLIPQWLPLLSSHYTDIREKTCSVISNIMSGEVYQVRMVVR